MNIKDKAIDIFMFREGTDEDEHGSSQPVITTGSVVWGMIFRSAVIVFLTFVIIDQFEIRSNWWIFSFILWFAAIYPGWRQYNKFTTRIKKIEGRDFMWIMPPLRTIKSALQDI
jgi:hypothetical protein